jgi:hypothetical protein
LTDNFTISSLSNKCIILEELKPVAPVEYPPCTDTDPLLEDVASPDTILTSPLDEVDEPLFKPTLPEDDPVPVDIVMSPLDPSDCDAKFHR